MIEYSLQKFQKRVQDFLTKISSFENESGVNW